MKCPECVETGERSRVYSGGSTSTAMGWQPYYDEDGIYHAHNPNRLTASFTCSNGHEFSHDMLQSCPARGCPHGKNPEQLAEELKPECCGGGPQWGHTFECPRCPD